MPEALVSPAGLRIVRLLVGKHPQTISELIQAIGVTRTAVSEQLNELVAAGLVVRTMERLPGRGRPRFLYAATHDALLLLFSRGPELVIPSIWRAIDQTGGRDLTKKVLKRATQSIADHYRPRITGRTIRERLHQIAEVWAEEGHLVDVIEDEQGRLLLRKRSCGFVSMFEETRTICSLDMDVIAALAQASLRRVECRHDGDPCCSFEVIPAGK